MSVLSQLRPNWLPHDWSSLPRFAEAQASFERLHEQLRDMDLSQIPEKVAEPISARPRKLTKAFKRKEAPDDRGESPEDGDAEDETEDHEMGTSSTYDDPKIGCDRWQQFQTSEPAHLLISHLTCMPTNPQKHRRYSL